ncbi:hypothetical protein FGX01_00350, partial [Xylella fastidiosa subsp. multiplex]|nr:hypothetical protein [Xylella fastidiosa subsp. multiplex]
LTCGEETTWAFNGAEWLAKNKRELIDAEFALNEGGGGLLDAAGKRQLQRALRRPPSLFEADEGVGPDRRHRLVVDGA